MLIKTMALIVLFAGHGWCDFRIPILSLENILSTFNAGGGGPRPGSSHKTHSKADYEAYLNDYVNYLQWQQSLAAYDYYARYYSLYGYPGYGPYPGHNPGPYPDPPPPTPTTAAPDTSSSTSSTPTTSTAIPTSTGAPTTSTAIPTTTGPVTTSTAVAPTDSDTTSTAVAPTDSETTSTAVAPTDSETTSTAVAPTDSDTTSTAVATQPTTTASPTTSTAVAPQDTDTTSTAVIPTQQDSYFLRDYTTPRPSYFVPSSLISPYPTLHRVGPQQIYIPSSAASALASASVGQRLPVFIPYNAIYERTQYDPYFHFVGRK
ncbi:uncharacterized protein Dana_GF27034 [Drosophila ananassae]|uniref:Uncharacterized protein n=1 Tax=Drosophila ananassae TaxID=7217 RepID=A0A0P8XMK7_DROAN|nr:cell wall protein DAN4 [Drosophila ananassae]KPU75905.1 uncharacterized protein Dana_GF27034 [Drosophila ananassae]